MRHEALTPAGLGWDYLGRLVNDEEISFGWFHDKTAAQALSSIIIARLPRSGRNGPQWHVSVFDRSEREPARPSAKQMIVSRCAFGLLTAEEDNHHPGRARHLFYPVDPSERVDCECKSDEAIVRESDGYQWTNPIKGACRGCEFEHDMRRRGLQRPCPIHTTKSAIALPHGATQ